MTEHQKLELTHLPKLPSTIFEADEDKTVDSMSQLREDEKKRNEMKEHEDQKKEESEEETGRSRKKSTSRPKSVERQASQGDESAIDKYYEKNQYSITGRFHKNEDTMQRIPKNFRRIIEGQRHAHGEPSAARVSTMSKRSQMTMPIAGAEVNRFVSSIYWIAQHNKKMGFRHVMMLLLMVVMTMAGGLIFYNLERPAEEADMAMKLARINETIKAVVSKMKQEMSENRTAFTDQAEVKEKLRQAYIQILQAEDRYKFSAIAKHDHPELHTQWGFWQGVFYCSDIFMTVSYGAVPAITNTGRVLAMLYATLAIPLAAVVLRDLGQWTLKTSTKIYARILFRWRRALGIETDEEEDVSFPVPIALVMIGVSWLLGALFTYVYDRLMSPDGTGISYWNSVYLSYLTVTTIGMGDMLPMHVPRSPLWKYVHFLLMPVRVVNRCTYVTIEGTIFGMFTKVENRMIELKIPRSVATIQQRKSTLPTDTTPAANQLTTRSIADCLKDGHDVYGGDFGRVRINKAHIE